MRQYYSRSELNQIAEDNNYKIFWQYRIAQNTGKEFEVGYVYIGNGQKDLFCKRNSSDHPNYFFLCNEFEDRFGVKENSNA